MAHRIRSMIGSSNMCENCGILPKFSGHNYCGKTCAAEAASKRKTAPQRIGVPGPSIPVVGSTSLLEPDTSELCENCYARPKSQETDEDGTIITQQYCGVRCYISSQRSIPPASNIPAAAAAPVSRYLSSLLLERVSTPSGRSILLMMQDRWQSEELNTPQLKSIYQIDLSNQVYRRFDLALQMNDGCPVTATYYGGIATCGISNDRDPAPCGSQSCSICDVLCNAFINMPCGASSRDGAYGPGLYTYKNPALAHHVAMSDNDQQSQDRNYVLIQCRVVTRENSGLGSRAFAGSIDDSGVVFCAQPAAIIPTHILRYRLSAPPDEERPEGTINVNLASISRTVSASIPASLSIGQPKSSTSTEPSQTKLKSVKGKGKGRAKGPLHQGEESGGTGASLTSVSALPVSPPTPLKPATGDTTQARILNTGTGPAVPPPTFRGLPNTPAPPPGTAKKGPGGDPQSTPLPPSPSPAPPSKSGTPYLTAAQEKAKLAQAAYNQAVTPGAFNATQSSGSNPPTFRGLPNTLAPPPGTAKKGPGGDPQSTPLPPSPSPAPPSKSGTPYLTAAPEKAKLAQAANNQAVTPGALIATQSSGSNAAPFGQGAKAASGGDPFDDAEGSPVSPPSYSIRYGSLPKIMPVECTAITEYWSAGGQMPQAMYETNLTSPGPATFYVQTQGGFIATQNPPTGIPLFLLGADGNFHQVPSPSAILSYPPVPNSVLSPVSAPNKGLLSSPAPDPGTAALRALTMNIASPPNNFSLPAQEDRMDVDDAFDYFSKDGTSSTARPGRPASSSNESNRTATATRAVAHFVSRSKDLDNRLDEDDD